MDPYDEFLNRERRMNPPAESLDRLEQRVMAELKRLPGVRRRKRWMVTGVSLGCAAVLLVLAGVIQPGAKSAKPPDFVESVVLLDNHVCIWLEISAKNP